jgi:hypothetical protein
VVLVPQKGITGARKKLLGKKGAYKEFKEDFKVRFDGK